MNEQVVQTGVVTAPVAVANGIQAGEMSEDVKAYIGPNTHKFLKTWNKIMNGDNWPLSWCWPVFLVGMPWFFYRKMYIEGAVVFLTPILIAMILPSLSGSGQLVFGMMLATSAKTYYLQRARKKIETISQTAASESERLERLQRAGGVSVAGAVVGGCLFASLLAIAIFAAMQGQKIS